MDTKRFIPGKPIILGLCGQAATGKTAVADILAPMGMYIPEENHHTQWDHLFFAMPLYELASIRRKIQGELARDRMLFEIHNVLYDLFGGSPLYGVPKYGKFTKFVKAIVDLSIDMDESVKPRSFLQQAGSMCREIDKDCFVKWTKKMITKRGLIADDEDLDYICVVSDVRLPNEAKFIAESPNGVVIKFEASPEVREKRLLNRDGFLLTSTQAEHVSEQIDNIKPKHIFATINSDDMTPKEQAQATKDLLSQLIESIPGLIQSPQDQQSITLPIGAQIGKIN